VIPGRQQGK